ncbi:MAG TPA: hypothetical protein VFD90_14705 [Gaiellales bacterium]|jgi:hypothetical protein|nr:hypothetical protein [Gaiellales bacterium]
MDGAERYLAAVVRVLPAARREWGRAMHADLAAIDRPSERWRFALSCTRVAVLPRARTREATRPLALIGAVALVLAAEIATAKAIGEVIPLVIVLLLLAWLGRRPGFLGPVRPDRVARAVRAGGYAVVGSCVLALVAADGFAESVSFVQSDSPRWGTLFALVVTLVTGVLLALTSRGARLGSTGLAAGVLAGIAAGVASFLVLPFERIGEPLAAGLPGGGNWLALVVFGAPAAAALVTLVRTRQAEQAVMAALCAGALAALLVAVLGLSAVVLFPGDVPNIVGPVMPPGTPLAQQHAANATEASDPYFGLLAFSGMLLALLWVMAKPPLRAATTVGLLCLLGIPPLALAGTAHDFPASPAIATATLAVVVGAVFTTRSAAGVSELDEAALT